MPGRWFDASQDAEFWDDEQLQAGRLREVVVYHSGRLGVFGTFLRLSAPVRENVGRDVNNVLSLLYSSLAQLSSGSFSLPSELLGR